MYSLKTALKRVGCGLLGLLLTLMLTLPGLARTTGPVPSAIEGEPALILGPSQVEPSSVTPGLDDPEDLDALVGNIFAEELEAGGVPGGAVAVVKDGEIFFARGYGYADIDQQIPVDAETTLFRVASLSKLFTATAVMQLQAEGLIDLEEPIARYLGDEVELENPFPTPVTFVQLLTHTDGSTKRRIGLAANTEAKLQPLEDYLADHLPPIVYPPGELFSYSSHSMALLGYLVQRISGEPFIDYIRDHILAPLDMNRSSFAQPPPHQEDLATGYQQQGGSFQPVPYLYLNIGPGAALSSTATDMAHFMIAHLQGGQYEGASILPPDAIAAMHRIRFRPHPQLLGTGYGFRERRINGFQTIGHLGSLRGYSSSLTLMPEQNIGIFIVSNSFSGVHGKLLRQFFDRYFPPRPGLIEAGATPSPVDPAELNLDRFVGTYRDLEYSRHTIAKLSAPYQHINIRRTDTGLEIQPPALFFGRDRPAISLEPLEPLLFLQPEQGAEAATLTAFEADEDGNILYAYNPIFPTMATYTKIAWYENIWFHAGILAVASLLFLSGVWVWPLHPALRRVQGKPGAIPMQAPQFWQVAGWVSLLNLVFLIGFPLALWLYGVWRLAYGMPWFGFVFLVLPMASALLTLVMVGVALWSWISRAWSTARRWHYTLLSLAAVLFSAVLLYWRVLGFQF